MTTRARRSPRRTASRSRPGLSTGFGSDANDSIVSDPTSGINAVWGGKWNQNGCGGVACGDRDDTLDIADGEGNDKATGDTTPLAILGSTAHRRPIPAT